MPEMCWAIMPDNKLPPSNREAERSVVGACIIDNDAIPRVSSLIQPEDFHYQELRELWAAMLALHERNEPVDVLTVSDELGRDEIPLLMIDLTNEVPTSVHAEHYAKMVAKTAERRRLLAASGKIAEAAFDDAKDPAQVEELALRLIMEARQNGTGGAQTLSALMRQYYDRIEALARSGGILGLQTGYHDLDKILGGLQRSDLILLAGRPKMGKSSLALCMARNIAKTGKRVVFFSLEMSSEQLTRRLTALEGEIGVTSLKTGKLSDAEWPAFMRAADGLDKLPIWIHDQPGMTPSRIRAEAMKAEAIAKAPLDLIMVDYLQLMRPDKRNPSRYEAVTEIGQALKEIAKDLNVPVLALSQLNRACENRADKRPMLHDLRESGDLEQTANIVMALYRDEVYDPNVNPGLAEVIVLKNRDGAEGKALLLFHGHLTRFVSADITREVL